MVNPCVIDYNAIASCISAFTAICALYISYLIFIENQKQRQEDLEKYLRAIRPFFRTRVNDELIYFRNIGCECLSLQVNHQGNKFNIKRACITHDIKPGKEIAIEISSVNQPTDWHVGSFALEGEKFTIILNMTDVQQNPCNQEFSLIIANQFITEVRK